MADFVSAVFVYSGLWELNGTFARAVHDAAKVRGFEGIPMQLS
jgi:hypothetical protein